MANVILVLLAVTLQAKAYMTEPITTFPHVSAETTPAPDALYGRELYKRRDACDQSQFFCPTGTCFTDPANGYIGCCSTTSCAPRTVCIEYHSDLTRQPCDTNTGGCLYCSQSINPHCFTITNVLAGQWLQYCATIAGTATLSYINEVTTGSQYTPATYVGPATLTATTVATATSTSTGLITSSASLASSALSPLSSDGASIAASSTPQISTDSSISSLRSFNTTAVTGASEQSPIVDSQQPTITPGVIGGVVAGGVVGIALLGVTLCVWQKQKKPDRSSTKSIKDESCLKNHCPLSSSPATNLTPITKEGEHYYSPSGFSQVQEADSPQIHEADSMPVVTGLGLGSTARATRSFYTISNPDAQQPGEPFVSPLLPSSSGQTPPTPVDRQHVFEVPYTPSIYGDGLPDSVQRPGDPRPPSLPQHYSGINLPRDLSAKELSSRDNRYYRDRGGEHDTSSAPWAYLSPENAINGGWRNPEA